MEHERELSQLAEEFESCRRINKMNGENRMTDLMQLMKERHSVRQYEDRPLEDGVVSALEKEIKACNKESGLHIQLVKNEKCGYYGERLVLKAQELGLNTCWVAMTYSKVKTAFTIDSGEKLCIVISLGYGKTKGVPHKSKSADAVTKADGSVPGWFRKGTEAALLAPTAMNQQKFLFTLNGNKVSAKAGFGFYSKIDLGIVKYHIEIGAGKENFQWA